jgi:predicted nucleic acid-binding protein
MYLDTSVVVKLYTREADSSACERILEGHRLVSSELLYAELWSALLAKERAGVLTSDRRLMAWELFESHLIDEFIALLPLDGLIVRDAAEIMAKVHPAVPLRTLDALHLATFGGIESGPIFTRDKRMMNAARELGFPFVA